ncbi:MAG: 50S ribosomal protein L35 [Parcubacteria group bacterium GW2011_GWC2_39_14]|nr:MAG: 50S ribosomal protein L35 [Parcubacteria group bacterium GW2011_GWC2_39_14]KKR54959.1 MAG: 50S ribosomal protein L35 [Parcubacteria group bacterium GW2011_GWA2_40_23]
MGKLKTQKSVVKRIRVTKTGKVMKKHAGQDHFNSRESGNTTRHKRRTTKLVGKVAQNAKVLIHQF